MITSIVDSRFAIENHFADVLEDAMTDQDLIFTGNSLLEIGFTSVSEIDQAIDRAQTVCTFNGLPLHRHFKAIFISNEDQHTLQRDWKLSRLAYTLTLLNGSSANPLVARLQMAVLNTYLTNESS